MVSAGPWGPLRHTEGFPMQYYHFGGVVHPLINLLKVAEGLVTDALLTCRLGADGFLTGNTGPEETEPIVRFSV